LAIPVKETIKMGKKYKKFGPFNFTDHFTESQRSKLRRARDDDDLLRRLEKENISIDKKKLIEDYDRLKKAIKHLNNR